MSLTGFQNPAKWFVNWIYGTFGSEENERTVTSTNALTYAPIWYGVTKIAGHIAQLPVSVYRRVEGGGEKVREHPVSRLMRRPNAYQTSTLFRETVATHSLLEGNGRAAIVRAGSKVTELIPLHPECTATGMIRGVKIHATRPSVDDRLRQFYADINDQTDSNGIIMLDDADVVHVPGLSFDGVSGLPLRKIAQRNLNAAINTEKRFAKQMQQGFAGNLMLSAPSGVFRKQEDADEFLEKFEAKHNSPEKAGKPGLLREGITASILASSNRDAEMTDNRKFQRQDAALWLGLEQILGDDSSVSYNSLEQKNLAYLMNCLNRWLVRWEEELAYKLLSTLEFQNDSHYIKFNSAALLRSDHKTTVESLSLAINSTIMSPNEAREKLDMLPYDGGDTHQNPAITPGGSAMETDTVVVDTGNAAVVARLQHLIGVEARRVEQAASKGRNYVGWVDAFYADNWEPKLANWFEELGIDRDAASTYCRESKRRLLDVCDYSTNDTLASNISKCVSTWKNRANTIGVVANV